MCNPLAGWGCLGQTLKPAALIYLLRFASERTLTINTAAIGGNAGLLAQSDETTLPTTAHKEWTNDRE